MKIVAISDTHGQHESLSLPSGDLLIHAGDVSSMGRLNEVKGFLEWFSVQPFEYKVFIPGNHDFYFEQTPPEEIKQIIPEGVVYLNDSCVEIEGLKIWGSPITPWFHNWAFNRDRGEKIRSHWDMIPNDIDVLITHGPPLGILDRTSRIERVGCDDLFEKVKQLKPKYHIFGHIHEGYGSFRFNQTEFLNASVLDAQYKLKNTPIVRILDV